MYFGINKHFHFDSANENFNRVTNGDTTYEIQGIETIYVTSEKNRVTILTRDSKDGDLLYGFSLDGQLIFKVEPPNHYNFWYLEDAANIACDAADELAESSPLSGWRFTINLDTGDMTKGSPVY